MNEALRQAFVEAGSLAAEQVTREALQRAAVLIAERLELPLDALANSKLGRYVPAAGAAEAHSEALCSGVAEFVASGFGKCDASHADGEVSRRGAHLLGELLDSLLTLRMQLEGAKPGRASARRSSGSFFTPQNVCALVVRQALEPLLLPAASANGGEPLRICDPAVGGGAFLIECAVLLSAAHERSGMQPEDARRRACAQLYGVDRSELALAVTELALWFWLRSPHVSPGATGARLAEGNALCGAAWPSAGASSLPALFPESVYLASSLPAAAFDWQSTFPEVAGGFGLVIGNPPWVAYAGRSAQALPDEWRSYYRRQFRAFAGFPTLHGLFVERAAALAPRGRVALLLPSALADLDGYRAAREALTQTHRVVVPLVELGQDVFEGVVQPSFVLVADAAAGSGSGAPWALSERARAGVQLVHEPPPPALARLGELPALPAAIFRELGFQSNKAVTAGLFLRAAEPTLPFRLPLLEGRNVREFVQDSPKLFLWDDIDELKKARCRLRPLTEYQRVDFVVRQTAAVTIAARHAGHSFRNSLLAGYAEGPFDADLLVGLLNSSLFRALHLSRQRDARQATFPQVKIAHLRQLPAPPEGDTRCDPLRRLSAEATSLGACPEHLRAELNRTVARLYGLTEAEGQAVERFLWDRLGKARPVAGESTERPCVVEPRGIEPLTS